MCTWFEEVEDGTLLLGSVQDLARYSARSCLSIVDLEVVDAEISRKRTLTDPVRRQNFMAALQALAEPVENRET